MNIEERVLRIVAEHLGVHEKYVKSDASVVAELGADSLDAIELVMALEDEFGIEIPDELAENWSTPQSAIDYIKSLEST